MKYVYIFLVLLLAAESCTSPKQLYRRGDLNGAVALAVEKVRVGKLSDKQKIYLEKAYNEITQYELSQIEQLKKDGNPSNAERILNLYQQINIRQQLVKPILPVYIGSEYRNAAIHLINIEDALSDAKNQTAEYLYTLSEKLLRAGSKTKAREAYQHYKKIASLFTEYKDMRWKMDTAYQMGITKVLLDFKYDGNQMMPIGIFDKMYQWDIQSMNIGWLQFTTKSDNTIDKVLLLHLNQTRVGPEQVTEQTMTESRRIQDGYTYAYDSAGRIKKDANGKEIKIKKYKDVFAVVRRVMQHKEGAVSGTYDVISSRNNQLMFSVPFSHNMVFHNEVASFIGDPRALSDATNAIVGRNLMPPPTNEQMIADGLQMIKNDVKRVIEGNMKKLEAE